MLPNAYKFKGLQNVTVGDEAALAKNKSQASGKAKARYRWEPFDPSQSSGAPGNMKRRAYTPGGPQGS